MTKRSYYTLLVREEGTWRPEFGDYDFDAVEYERIDYREKGVRGRDLRIISTRSSQDAVMARVAQLNKAIVS